MAELHLRIEDSFVDEINKALWEIQKREEGRTNKVEPKLTANQIGCEALAVYRWVIQQTRESRAVVAADKDCRPVMQISTPSLPPVAPDGWTGG